MQVMTIDGPDDQQAPSREWGFVIHLVRGTHQPTINPTICGNASNPSTLDSWAGVKEETQDFVMRQVARTCR